MVFIELPFVSRNSVSKEIKGFGCKYSADDEESFDATVLVNSSDTRGRCKTKLHIPKNRVTT